MLPDDLTEITFTAKIKLFADDLEEAEGDVKQAVQNMIGGSGAQVVDVEDEVEDAAAE